MAVRHDESPQDIRGALWRLERPAAMKNLASPEIDRWRFEHPVIGQEPDELRAWGGVFQIPYERKVGAFTRRSSLRVIASRGGCPDYPPEMDAAANRWDHVSISCEDRCPTWEEMEFIKRLFFDRHECAMQLHVPPRDHVNNHEYCLHIWRPLDCEIPRPPSFMVGSQDLGVIGFVGQG